MSTPPPTATAASAPFALTLGALTEDLAATIRAVEEAQRSSASDGPYRTARPSWQEHDGVRLLELPGVVQFVPDGEDAQEGQLSMLFSATSAQAGSTNASSS